MRVKRTGYGYDGGELKPTASDGSWACVLPLAPNPRVLGYSCGGPILAYSATWPASNPTSPICFIVRVRDDSHRYLRSGYTGMNERLAPGHLPIKLSPPPWATVYLAEVNTLIDTSRVLCCQINQGTSRKHKVGTDTGIAGETSTDKISADGHWCHAKGYLSSADSTVLFSINQCQLALRIDLSLRRMLNNTGRETLNPSNCTPSRCSLCS